MGNAVDKFERLGERNRANRNTPFVNQASKDTYDSLAGAAKIFKGDVREGAGQAWNSALSSLSGGPIWAMNQPPDPTYLGGSAEELARTRAGYEGLMGLGTETTGKGVDLALGGADMLGGAYNDAGTNRNLALEYSNAGMGMGATGMADRGDQIRQLLAAAQQQGPSAAEAQMRMGLNQTQNAMMAQAASARGGNQAAAMRGAQANSAQMANQVNQQAAILRAQEQAAQQNRMLGAHRYAADAYGSDAALGYGMGASGLGLAGAATAEQNKAGANYANVGLGLGSVGNATTSTGANAKTKTDAAQLAADEKQESAKHASKGIVSGMVSKIASMF